MLAIAEPDTLPPIPPTLQGSVQRHQRHLAELVATLRGAGLDDATIDAQLGSLIASYHAELAAAIQALRGVE